MGLIGSAKGWWGARRFNRTALGQALQQHTRSYFYSDHSLSWFQEESKARMIGDFYNKVGMIAAAANPTMALREAMSEYVIAYAQVTVLTLTEEEKAQMPWAENPYISGQLSQYVREAQKHSDEMIRHAADLEGFEVNDLLAFLNTRGAVNLYYANGLNMVRIDMGDRSSPKDWFRPFVEASLVWEEDNIRQRLGLPELVTGGAGALVYSAFLNYILAGEPDPPGRFRREFPDHYQPGGEAFE